MFSTNSKAEPIREKALKDYTIRVMNLYNVNFSETKKQLLAEKISKVSVKYISAQDGQAAFVIVLAIESAFNGNIGSSPAGAVGISQLMPVNFLGFAKECNIKVKQEDINDPDVNLVIGACRFNTIMKTEANPLIAIAAYNAGLHSITVKKLKKGEKINKETHKYLEDYKKAIKELNNG